MFELEYKGGNSVLITTKDRQLLVDGNVTLLGLKELKIKDAVNLATEKRFLPDDSQALSLEGPGEYEAGPFAMRGIAMQRMIDTEKDEKKATSYRIEIGDVSLGVLGNIAPNLSEDQLEGLGLVDILIVPVGGNGYTLDATDAIKLIRQIEPKAVVPIHYDDPALKYEVPQESAERFEHELSAPVEALQKLKIKGSASLPSTLTVYNIIRS